MLAAVKRTFTDKGNMKYMLVAGLVIIGAYFAFTMTSKRDGMAAYNSAQVGNPPADMHNIPQPMQDDVKQYAPAIGGNVIQTPGVYDNRNQSPSELLPTDNNNEWAQLNPVGRGDLANVNLLKAGEHVGINTVGSSMRNANLQVRSEPANPQMNTGPWNKSTIDPDVMRPSLEIGQGKM
jgi:hypothetical protein